MRTGVPAMSATSRGRTFRVKRPPEGSPPSALLLATVPFEKNLPNCAITEAGARIDFGYHSTCLRHRTPAPRRQSL
jgi:hypothetical protein